MYKPLPDSLTIKPSKVNGLGLFAKEVIPQATNLGMTHLEIGKTILRTPLGGFINHANDPNCIKVKLLMTNHDDPKIIFRTPCEHFKDAKNFFFSKIFRFWRTLDARYVHQP